MLLLHSLPEPPSTPPAAIELCKCRDASIYRADGGKVFYRGSITSASAAALVKELRQDDALYISSGGGENAAGLDIGEAVFRLKVRVHVLDSCESACAQFVFLPSVARTQEPGTYVFFHDSPMIGERLVREHALYLTADERALIESNYDRTTRLFAEANVDTRLLACIDKLEQPDWSSVGRYPEPGLRKKYDYVVVAPAVLASFGVKGTESLSSAIGQDGKSSVQNAFPFFKLVWLDSPTQC